jgi:hypothetical protein
MNLTLNIVLFALVTVGIGSVAMVVLYYKVQLLASMICAYQVVLVVGFKLATLLVPYAPGWYLSNK